MNLLVKFCPIQRPVWNYAKLAWHFIKFNNKTNTNEKRGDHITFSNPEIIDLTEVPNHHSYIFIKNIWFNRLSINFREEKLYILWLQVPRRNWERTFSTHFKIQYCMIWQISFSFPRTIEILHCKICNENLSMQPNKTQISLRFMETQILRETWWYKGDWKIAVPSTFVESPVISTLVLENRIIYTKTWWEQKETQIQIFGSDQN